MDGGVGALEHGEWEREGMEYAIRANQHSADIVRQ